MNWSFRARALVAPAILLLLALPAHASSRTPPTTGDVTGLVTDSTTGTPLPGAEVLVLRDAEIITRTNTDRLGRYRVHDLTPGGYVLEVRLIGYHPVRRPITMTPAGTDVVANFTMRPAEIELSAIRVASTPITVDTRTGNQVFNQDEYQGSPVQTTSQILQQAIVGAARAPTGEVHIRGQHAEYSYYVDGVPVPAGISGSLNELFDPAIVNQIQFQTGAWDAEYGGKNAAVVNVTTRVPSGGFHASASGYGGNYAANGQTLTLSGNSGRWGLFLAGTRQSTDMRREPVQGVVDTNSQGLITSVRSIENFSNHGEDYFSFGKLAYSPTSADVINLDANWSRTSVQTPFDSSAGIIDDHEVDVNGFVNLGWQHRVTSGATEGSELFAAAFYRHGTLSYVPGPNDAPSFTFAPDTTPYNISEARAFDSYGVKLDYLLRLREELSFKFGTLSSIVRGHENFQSFDSTGAAGPASNSSLDGTDFGVYAQMQYAPTELWELRAGLRYDRHRYPLSPALDTTVSQLSPRVRLSLFPNPQTSIWAYYGRQFIPTNTEDLRNITSASQGGVVSSPTVPERDDFFELGLTHRFRSGVVVKLAGYHKRSAPGIDDTQVPGTAITTNVNIDHIRVTGLEGGLEIRPSGPLSGFLNAAINHAYGYGAVTGGFFAITPPAQSFDLDHDQRVSIAGGLTYGSDGLLATVTGIYGSGLTNGVTPNYPAAPGYDSTLPATGPHGTGLFDFNKEFKVDPSFIVSASLGYTFVSHGVAYRPQLFVDNVFDRRYLLKGQFFSGTQLGKPRTIQLRMSVGI